MDDDYFFEYVLGEAEGGAEFNVEKKVTKYNLNQLVQLARNYYTDTEERAEAAVFKILEYYVSDIQNNLGIIAYELSQEKKQKKVGKKWNQDLLKETTHYINRYEKLRKQLKYEKKKCDNCTKFVEKLLNKYSNIHLKLTE